VTSTFSREHPVNLVRGHLESRGLQVLDQRWRYSFGDLDLVAADQGVFVACAVRVRRPRVNGDPAHLSEQKVRLLRRLAVRWMQEHAVRYDQVRADVAVVSYEGTGGYTIEHVKGVG